MHREILKVINSGQETVDQSGIDYRGAWQYALDRGEKDNRTIDFISFKIPLGNNTYLVTVFEGLRGSAGLTVRDMNDINREAAEFIAEHRRDLVRKEIVKLYVTNNTNTVKIDLSYSIANEYALEQGGNASKQNLTNYVLFKTLLMNTLYIVIASENADGTTALTVTPESTGSEVNEEEYDHILLSSIQTPWS